MSERIFPAGTTPRVVITHVDGDLSVHAWNRQEIKLDSDARISELYQEGDALMIIGSKDDIELWAPADAAISATNVSGDVEIKGVRLVKLKNIGSDVELEDISEAIELTDVGADLEVTNAPKLLSRGSVGAGASLTRVGLVEIETVGADLKLERIETVVVSTVRGDLDADGVAAALRCGSIGGDCQVQGSAQAEITVGNTGGDLDVSSAANLQAGNVGSDCEVHGVKGDVEIGLVGADASLVDIRGNLQLGSVGADAELRGLHGNIEVGSVGANLELQAEFPPDSLSRLNVGGDAYVVLPDNPNLSIRATVGGHVSGQSIASTYSGNLINLTYADGAAHLELTVGGDLELGGTGSPRSSSSSSWGDLGHEMANLSREMGKLGQEISREIAAAFTGTGWSQGADIADEIARKVDERARRAQQRAKEHARRAEERARRAGERAGERTGRAGERAGRINIRFNDREWRLDPERLERIKEQARRAAAEGVFGAFEAVERAMGKMHVPMPPWPAPPTGTPPVPPRPPTGAPPVPPVPPQPFSERPGPVPGQEKAQSEQVAPQSSGSAHAASSSSTSATNVEQEREAILTMVAEGRITPEEGDLLLEALGS